MTRANKGFIFVIQDAIERIYVCSAGGFDARETNHAARGLHPLKDTLPSHPLFDHIETATAGVDGSITPAGDTVVARGGSQTYISRSTLASLGMLMNVSEIGSDLEFRGSVAAPTLRIDGLTVAGE